MVIRIKWPAFIGEERRAARLLDLNLISLEQQITLFSEALALADYCDEQRAPYLQLMEASRQGEPDMDALIAGSDLNLKFIRWKMLAIRDGAITLYNFAENKQAIEKLIQKCPSFKDKLDRETYSEAGRVWEQSFPGHAHIRLSVAHSGVLFDAVGDWEKHSIPGTTTITRHMVSDRTMSSSINSKMAKYSLTRDSLDVLTAIKDAIYRAYKPIVEATWQLPIVDEQES